MIPTITTYLYRLQHERQYWLSKSERRRAILLCCALTTLITISVLMWILYR
jgi:hypothetical protein